MDKGRSAPTLSQGQIIKYNKYIMYITKSNFNSLSTSSFDKFEIISEGKFLDEFKLDCLHLVPVQEIKQFPSKFSNAINRQFKYKSKNIHKVSTASYHRKFNCKNLNSEFDGIDFNLFYKGDLLPSFAEFRKWFLKTIPFNLQSNAKFINEKIQEYYGVDLELKSSQVKNSGIMHIYNFPLKEIVEIINMSIVGLYGSVEDHGYGMESILKSHSAIESKLHDELFFKFYSLYIMIVNIGPVQYDTNKGILDIAGLSICPMCRASKVTIKSFNRMSKLVESNYLSDLLPDFTRIDKFILNEIDNYKDLERIKSMELVKIKTIGRLVGWMKIIYYSKEYGLIVSFNLSNKNKIYFPVNDIGDEIEIVIGETYLGKVTIICVNSIEVSLTNFNKKESSWILNSFSQGRNFYDLFK